MLSLRFNRAVDAVGAVAFVALCVAASLATAGLGL